MIDSQYPPSVQTTGYTWDADLQEFNNILPRFWRIGFYATLVFAIFCWLLYPAWPLGRNYTKGYLNRIHYQSQGATILTHWNTRALLRNTLEKEENNERRRAYLQRMISTSFQEITANPELTAFSQSLAKSLFGDNCAPCHNSNSGFAPNFASESQIKNKSFEQIAQFITHGHKLETGMPGIIQNSFIPTGKNRLSIPEIKALTIYVQQLGIVKNKLILTK